MSVIMGAAYLYTIPHARNLPLPVISLRPRSPTIRAACGAASSVYAGGERKQRRTTSAGQACVW